ncbi:winged helix-turn-helix transcriptional regulator [Acinetobacter sp. ANC 4648]|uniref:winged helix-turn-helix transcriptional regulator n=1 Tax=Acinetobacter sp. ANC 4648 TaxID=1977875 RepID=UPI000A33BEBA|nr:helix-turn-helix domain-containing protein [Acinetobacter sp. ANC 4648]OTG81723.1 hypothetical protein B9T27_10685 [Acinetobacter sp. ANC 4648]
MSLILLENCPRRRIHKILEHKWNSMILYVLSHNSLRTGELQRCMPGISKKMLIQSLKELERYGLIDRKVYEVIPPHVSYSLTEIGKKVVEPLFMLYEWADKNEDILDIIEQNMEKAN